MQQSKLARRAVPLFILLCGLWPARVGGDRPASVVGAGRIGEPIPGVTVHSPSDFGFAVGADGGTFVCSMAGPETGGFAGFRVMLVEGPVTPGSLRMRGRDVTFSGHATIALVPGLGGTSHTVLDGVPYTVFARAGAENQSSMILRIPDFTQALGGDTGGVVVRGGIRRAGD